MRDPRRIADILNELGIYWMNNPDLRLGQIVVSMNGKTPTGMRGSFNDPFNTEDDEMLEALRNENNK
jgi:uncharacterized protein YihD (DUF1040 family)